MSSSAGGLPPLPHAPSFPTYGLPDGQLGAQWLELWNAPNELTDLDIAHGNPDFALGPSVVVLTHAKQPERRGHAREGVAGPALGALLYWWHAARARQPERAEPSTQAAIDQLVALSEALHPPAWTPCAIPVAGDPVAAHVLARDEMWVAAVDLGPLALGVFANRMPLDELRLEPVGPDVLALRRPA